MARNDVYLSLCLEQASLSPLHYRHGCIVVRGGKVIGKGYNDYRSGFNGGVQITGRLSSAAASNTLRAKKIGKNVPSDGRDHPTSTRGEGAFGCKNRASNYRLVLNKGPAYSTSKPTPMSSTEPLSSRPRRSSFVVGPTFKSLVLKPRHLNFLQRYPNHTHNVTDEEEEKAGNVSTHRNPGDNNVHHHAQLDYLKAQKSNSRKARQPTSDDSEKHRKQYLYGLSDGVQDRHHGRHDKTQHLTHQHQQQKKQQRSSAVIMPQHRILTKSHQTAERMKDSRLNGADLYVARLAKRGKAEHRDCGCQHDHSLSLDDGTAIKKGGGQLPTESETSSASSLPRTGSLHDELQFPLPKEKKKGPLPQSAVKEECATASHSKPCYRCISYMHSAGIKRVFWTNSAGHWEGGKVRDLVDTLESPALPNAKNRGEASIAGSVYVTKSEVLLLKGLQ
ncbi:MAG: hypothetical protein Q9185_005198 [Variospora sp. 1 TL-2023]